MKILCCGGRSYWDREKVNKTLAELKPTVIISGMASGADWLGYIYAQEHHIPVLKFPANWALYGKSAGFIRNIQMLDEAKPELVVAFPGGAGTAHTVREAKLRKIPVLEVS